MNMHSKYGIEHSEYIGDAAFVRIVVDGWVTGNEDRAWQVSGKGWDASVRPMQRMTVTVTRDGDVLLHEHYVVRTKDVTTKFLETVALQAAVKFAGAEVTR